VLVDRRLTGHATLLGKGSLIRQSFAGLQHTGRYCAQDAVRDALRRGAHGRVSARL
jgi:hypothetical protein